MSMYNLTEYSDNYSKSLGSLWEYYRHDSVSNDGTIADFSDNKASDSFNFNKQKTGQADNDDTEDVEIMALTKISK